MIIYDTLAFEEYERASAAREADNGRLTDDEPPTRCTLNSLAGLWSGDCYYAVARWNAQHPDRALVVDGLELLAACDAGIAGAFRKVRTNGGLKHV